MKIKEVMVQEQQLNEFVWTPAATAGLAALVGPEAASLILIALAIGIPFAVGAMLTDTKISVKEFLSDLSLRRAGKKLTQTEIRNTVNEIKKKLSRYEKGYITSLENQLQAAIKEKDYKEVASLFNLIKNKNK